MCTVEFIYKGYSTFIQCNYNDKMKDIFIKFATKAQLDINSIYFLYDGITINKELILEQINKGKDTIIILVNDINSSKTLKFNLNNYNIIITFAQYFDIKAELGESLNKKIYNGSFSIEELKSKSKFFKMFDSIEDTYNDIKMLLEQNSFYIQTNENCISLCIRKQIGIQYDIEFPLKEDYRNLKYVVEELCEKNINLEKKVDMLTEKNLFLEKKINEICEINFKFEKKIEYLEKIIENMISKEKTNKNEIIELIDNYEEMRKIKSLFDEKVPIKINLIYNGEGCDRKEFFEKCNGKDNLLFLVNDERGEKYGGYMSAKLIKNKKGKCLSIRDEKSFIFNIDTLKKFKVLKPEKAIEIRDNYLICFGGDMEKGNDFYIRADQYAGRSTKDSYGDIKYEITNGDDIYKINELKIYQLFFQ